MPPCRAAISFSPTMTMDAATEDEAQIVATPALYSTTSSTPPPPEPTSSSSIATPLSSITAPSPTALAVASTNNNKVSRRPTSKRMPRDPVTNQRICYDFVRGCCPRAAEACRYAHTSPPVLLGAFWRRAGNAPGGAWDLTALQQALTRTLHGDKGAQETYQGVLEGSMALQHLLRHTPTDPTTGRLICLTYNRGLILQEPRLGCPSDDCDGKEGEVSDQGEEAVVGEQEVPPRTKTPCPFAHTDLRDESVVGGKEAWDTLVADVTHLTSAINNRSLDSSGTSSSTTPPGSTTASRPFRLPHLRKSTMPMDEASQKKVCFYYNVMTGGCRKDDDACDYAHVYVEGAQEEIKGECEGERKKTAHEEEKEGVDGKGGLKPSAQSQAKDKVGPSAAATAQQPSQRHVSSPMCLPPPPAFSGSPYAGSMVVSLSKRQHSQGSSTTRSSSTSKSSISTTTTKQQHYRRSHSHSPPQHVRDASGTVVYYPYATNPPPPPVSAPPPPPPLHHTGYYLATPGHSDPYMQATAQVQQSHHQHQQHAFDPTTNYGGSGGGGGGGGGGGNNLSETKSYVNMPRTETGQRVCYYFNAARCLSASCPFAHVLVDMSQFPAISIPRLKSAPPALSTSSLPVPMHDYHSHGQVVYTTAPPAHGRLVGGGVYHSSRHPMYTPHPTLASTAVYGYMPSPATPYHPATHWYADSASGSSMGLGEEQRRGR